MQGLDPTTALMRGGVAGAGGKLGVYRHAMGQGQPHTARGSTVEDSHGAASSAKQHTAGSQIRGPLPIPERWAGALMPLAAAPTDGGALDPPPRGLPLQGPYTHRRTGEGRSQTTNTQAP